MYVYTGDNLQNATTTTVWTVGPYLIELEATSEITEEQILSWIPFFLCERAVKKGVKT